jgi:hypothetical protein
MKNLLQDINSDMAEELSECASDIFFMFISQIEGTELYDKYIIEHEIEGTKSTELGSELFYEIEDRLFKLNIPTLK